MQRTTARIAGALYLLSAVAAGLPLIYVSGTLIAPDDAAKTAGNILASAAFFRACMVSELIGASRSSLWSGHFISCSARSATRRRH
jgi:Domain of unknown function (DUF4386)